MFKCVAFDVDGTLIDSKEAILASLREVLREELGREFPEEELVPVLGIPGARGLARLGVPDVPAALAKWDAYVRQYDHLITVFPGIEETLTALREAGVTLGLVTSKTRVEFDHDFRRLGLTDYFNAIVCADDTPRHKPDPDPILKLLADTGLHPTDVVYVGDTVYDSRCARAAGVKFALALWGTLNPAVPCDYRVQHPSDLLRLCRTTP